MNLVVKDLFDTLLQFVSDGHKKRRASSLSAIFAISGAMKAQPPMGPPSAADVDKKLDDMAKKDASTAVNFFRQGVVNLKQAFGAMLSSAEGQLDDREASGSYSTVLEAKLVAELLKNKDHATVKKFLFGAGEKFRLSRAKATEAFSNEVLPTNDRVTSAKIQIAATILEHVDSLGDAVQECVHYLENVHALTAVKRDMKVGLRPFFFSRLGHKNVTFIHRNQNHRCRRRRCTRWHCGSWLRLLILNFDCGGDQFLQCRRRGRRRWWRWRDGAGDDDDDDDDDDDGGGGGGGDDGDGGGGVGDADGHGLIMIMVTEMMTTITMIVMMMTTITMIVMVVTTTVMVVVERF